MPTYPQDEREDGVAPEETTPATTPPDTRGIDEVPQTWEVPVIDGEPDPEAQAEAQRQAALPESEVAHGAPVEPQGEDAVTGPQDTLLDAAASPVEPGPSSPADAEVSAPGPEASRPGEEELVPAGEVADVEPFPQVDPGEIVPADAPSPLTQPLIEEDAPAGDADGEVRAEEATARLDGSKEAPEAEVGSGEAADAEADDRGWVAGVSVDPDWYNTQDSPDELPEGQEPRSVPLPGTRVAVGRTSVRRNIRPDIDCGADTGCSRRHAELVFDGASWTVTDLDSANGTYVRRDGGPMPDEPISGPTKLAEGDSVLVGSWTSITLRRAPLH
ncbi:FHA domain-containing protein [Nigerium massiliense]|uniref:FHA domain-containing protein n=1 Tax=Nigerium massiliense TaxID=1522317 RepID=UPI000BE9B714|nr:FHA domain-containing protein [Nigerium massiliense]